MRKHRVLVTTFATLFALGVIGVAQAWAQNRRSDILYQGEY